MQAGGEVYVSSKYTNRWLYSHPQGERGKKETRSNQYFKRRLDLVLSRSTKKTPTHTTTPPPTHPNTRGGVARTE